jgi:Tfp pilus assembly protein PilF
MKRFITPALLVVFLLSFFSTNSSIAQEPYRKKALEAKGAEKNKAAEINNDGVRHFSGRHWTESSEFFEDALKIDPNLAEAHFNLGLVLHKKNKHKAATEHFRKAVELAPKDKRIGASQILKEHMRHKKGTKMKHKENMMHGSGMKEKMMHESEMEEHKH